MNHSERIAIYELHSYLLVTEVKYCMWFSRFHVGELVKCLYEKLAWDFGIALWFYNLCLCRLFSYAINKNGKVYAGVQIILQ